MADQVRLDKVGDLITALTIEHVTAFMSADGESGHATVMKIIEAMLGYVGRPITLARPDPSWDASGGTFPASATAGTLYITTVSGTVGGVAFEVNDQLLCLEDNASTTTYAANWLKLDYTDQVLSVAGLTGAITAAALRTALSLAAIATSGSASDLTTGAVPDGRLPDRLKAISAQGVFTDCDAIKESGFYFVLNTAAHRPVGSTHVYILCIAQTVQGFRQIALDPVSAKAWSRYSFFTPGTWSEWEPLIWTQAQQGALWTSIANLASTDEGKGAALVGIEAIDGLPGVTNVQAALATLASGDSAIGAAIAALPFGAVGTHVWGYIASAVIEGDTYAGSGIYPAGAFVSGGISAGDGNASFTDTRGGTALTGTWMAMGRNQFPSRPYTVTLFKRVE